MRRPVRRLVRRIWVLPLFFQDEMNLTIAIQPEEFPKKRVISGFFHVELGKIDVTSQKVMACHDFLRSYNR